MGKPEKAESYRRFSLLCLTAQQILGVFFCTSTIPPSVSFSIVLEAGNTADKYGKIQI